MKNTYVLSTFVVFTVIAAVATAQQPTTPQSGMAGMGPAMKGHDSSTMAEMGAIHELMVNHGRINRTVTNLTDGIRTVTESDDPQIAKIIKEHVSGMDQRVSAGNDPGLPLESPALHSIFRNADKVHTSIQITANGAIVVQTSTDPETVAVLQKHASEVSDLVKGGIAAMHASMMQNGMRGGMMGNRPKGETPNKSAAKPQVNDQDSLAQGHDQHQADHMEHHFDPKDSAKSFDDPARDTWQLPDRVIAALNLKRGQIVADIGAGTGYFSVRLAKSEAAPKVYAADIEPSMVSYLRERATEEGLNNVTAVQAAADQPNLPEPVDIVLIVDTYHHIGDRETYFRKLTKSIKPGGQVAIIDFKPDSPEGPPQEFRFRLDKFKSEMGKAGYKLAAQHNFLPRQQFLIFEVAGPSPR